MTVVEFLDRQLSKDPDSRIAFLPDLLTLLDEFDGDSCSVLAGKIRWYMGRPERFEKIETCIKGLETLKVDSYVTQELRAWLDREKETYKFKED